MATQVGIRKVIAEQSLEGAVIHLAERVEALEKQLAELNAPAPAAYGEPKTEEGV